MKLEQTEVTINGVVYVQKGTEQPKMNTDNAVIIRTRSAGVFFGYKTSAMEKLEHGIVELSQARRLWFWSGANTISCLAIFGTMKPKECKFCAPLDSITLTEVIEVVPCTKESVESISGVPVWKQ